jgi:hypothetical protein
VDTRAFDFAIALACFLVSLLAVAGYYYVRARRVANDEWSNLLKRLILLDRNKIEIVALEQSGSDLDPARVLELIGGLDGLKALNANCDVLIDLASHCQRWYPEALLVTEQLRLNAREIKWHLTRLEGAAQRGNLGSAFADYAQRMAATYRLMTQHLLALYEQTNLPEFTELQKVI